MLREELSYLAAAVAYTMAVLCSRVSGSIAVVSVHGIWRSFAVAAEKQWFAGYPNINSRFSDKQVFFSLGMRAMSGTSEREFTTFEGRPCLHSRLVLRPCLFA